MKYKYAITIRNKGQEVAEGHTPQEAFYSICPNVDLFRVKDASNATVCIDLLEGQRKSTHYYIMHGKNRMKKFLMKDVNATILNAELLGMDVETVLTDFFVKAGYKLEQFGIFATACGHHVILIVASKHCAFYLIPCNVTRIDNNMVVIHVHPKANLCVMGGENLISTKDMLKACYANTIDLALLNTDKVTDMRQMFYMCTTTTINFANFNTENVTDMSDMFANSKIKYMDLSNFSTQSLQKSRHMFDEAQIKTTKIYNDKIMDLFKKGTYKQSWSR